MKSKSIFDSENFLIDVINGISIITINVPRATSNEADEFKQILHSIVLTNHNKIIIDFSRCQYADSIIIGIMVEIVKTIRKNNGDIFVITPASSIKIMFARTGLFKIFKQFWTKEEAIESFSVL
jgi:anti-anti-sigma factor